MERKFFLEKEWNGTCYKEGSEICAIENERVLSQIFMVLDEIP